MGKLQNNFKSKKNFAIDTSELEYLQAGGKENAVENTVEEVEERLPTVDFTVFFKNEEVAHIYPYRLRLDTIEDAEKMKDTIFSQRHNNSWIHKILNDLYDEDYRHVGSIEVTSVKVTA